MAATQRVNDISRRTIGAAITVHRTLGPGLLEGAYLACLLYQLRSDGLKVVANEPVPVQYGTVRITCGYELDLLVEDTVIVELKAVRELAPIHQAQLLTYLKLTGCPLGLLINFNVTKLVDGVKRMINAHPAERFAAPVGTDAT